MLAEQGSPPQYCFKKVVIQKLSSTECSLEFVLTEEKKTELGLGEQYLERESNLGISISFSMDALGAASLLNNHFWGVLPPWWLNNQT